MNGRTYRLGQAEPLIGGEEEGLVAINPWNKQWAAQGSAKAILPERWLWNSVMIIEPVVGIEVAVAQVVEGTPMQNVGTGASR